MKTLQERLADRANPAYAKPGNYDAIVIAARDAARAARSASLPYEVLRDMADKAAFTAAGLALREDSWADRADLNDAD